MSRQTHTTAESVLSAVNQDAPLCSLAGWRWETTVQNGLALWSPTQTLPGESAPPSEAPVGNAHLAHDGLLIFARHAPPIFVTTSCVWEWSGFDRSLRVRGPAGQPLIVELAPDEVLAIVKLPSGVRPRRRLAHADELSAQASRALARAGLLRPTHMALTTAEQPAADVERGGEAIARPTSPAKPSLH